MKPVQRCIQEKKQHRGSLASIVRVFLILGLVLGWMSASSGEEKVIQILYVNDFHGFAEPHTPFGSKEMLGGAAYLAEAVNRLRSEEPTLLVAAGDMIQGNSWANLSQGESVIELMNAMKFDAMVVGNHEFDFGQDVLKKRIAQAHFPILGANVIGMEELKPYTIKEVGGIKVGILGVVGEDTPVLTHPNRVLGLKFISPQEAIRKYLPELSQKSDMVILLSHIGHEADKHLAEKVEGIDLIIGGHSHTKVTEAPAIGETIILQAWEHGKALGVVDIAFEDGEIESVGGHLKEIKPSEGAADKAAEAIVLKYKTVVDSILDQKIGEAGENLDSRDARTRESNFGNFLADIMREVSKADAALVNAGSIRTSIPKGDIKGKDIYNALPFDNYIVAVRLTGRQLREALEHGLASAGKGGFPQISGIHLTYDPSGRPGAKIKEIRIQGKTIDPDREYRVATNDFLAAGGDAYEAFGDAIKSSKDFAMVGGAMKGERLVYSDPGRWLRDIVLDYIKTHKKISPRVEGRMTEIKKP